MNELIETFGMVSRDPVTWIGVAAMVMLGLGAAYRWRSCPHICGTAEISREDAIARLQNPLMAGPRYFLTMLAGIVAILTGLGLIAQEISPPKAFLLLLAGVYLVQTEPIRLRIRESTDRLIAAEAEGPEAVEIARERLRSDHLFHVFMNLALAGLVSAGLLAF